MPTPSAPPRSSGALAIAASIAALLFAAPLLRATDVDPTKPVTVVVGPPPGIAPMARIDGARSGRARHPLPARPRVLWRRSLHGGLDLAPVAVDRRGALVVTSATLPQLWQLTADGKDAWSAPLASGPSVAGVVLLSDETRAVVTSGGDLIGVTPGGAIRFTTPLDLTDRNARTDLLPLEDGGLAVSAGREVVEIDGDGHVRARAHLDERIAGPLLSMRAGIVATTVSGAIHGVRGSFVRRLGSLGGDPGEPGASSPDGQTLYAAVDHQRVVAVDLGSGSAQVRFGVGDGSLHGPIVFGPRDRVALASWSGVLLTLPKGGGEPGRTPLEARPTSLMTDAGRVDFAALEESPPIVADDAGRIAFARVGGRIGVVGDDGVMSLVSGVTCPSPAALAPAGEGRMVVACRGGAVLLIGEESR